MGAVCGFLSGERSVDPCVVERMLARSPHRGADRRVVTLGGAVLGVADGDGVAPATLAGDRTLAVAFSGWLDNADELIRDLPPSSGPGPEPEDPAAVVHAAFHAWGEETPARMRGIYAVLMTDGESLWAFRDQIGFRPLFYRADAGRVWVASEAKQVVEGAGIPYEPDPEALERIFFGRLEEGGRTALRGVERLAARTLLRVGPSGVTTDRYWRPEELLERRPVPADELEERFDHLMARAVRRCLHGRDVVSLSGGIDSPAIAAYGAPLYRASTGEGLPALSSVYPDHGSVDESRYISAVAEELGLRLQTYVPTARPTDDLARWVKMFDGPVPVISLAEGQEHLSLARELGFRNVLTGEFAEHNLDRREHVLPHLIARGRWPTALRYMRRLRRTGAGVKRLVGDVARGVVPRRGLKLYKRLRGRPTHTSVVAPDWLDPDHMSRTPLIAGHEVWRARQLGSFEAPALALEANDYIQSVNGVSVRRPFADVDLWEFFLGLPADVKHPDSRSKTLLRRLLRGKVPDIILDRRDKTVFNEFIYARIDYETLRRWLVEPDGFRVPGVDYETLGRRLRQERLDLKEFLWAKDLAAVHAFLSAVS